MVKGANYCDKKVLKMSSSSTNEEQKIKIESFYLQKEFPALIAKLIAE